MGAEDRVFITKQLVLLGYIGGRLNLDKPDVYPLEGGRVEIEWCTENRSVLIEVCEDGSAAMIWSKNGHVKQELENILPPDFADRVDEAFAWLAEDAFDWNQIGDIG